MVDYAIDLLGKVEKLGLTIETWHCVPDGAVVAARRLHHRCKWNVVDLDRVAVSAFDRKTGRGVRVFLDPKKTAHYERIHKWLFQTEEDEEDRMTRIKKVLAEINEAGRNVLSQEFVYVTLEPEIDAPVVVCEICGEAFFERKSDLRTCKACDGHAYFMET